MLFWTSLCCFRGFLNIVLLFQGPFDLLNIFMLFQGFFEHLFAVSGAFWPFEHLYAVSGAFWTASCCFSHGHFFCFLFSVSGALRTVICGGVGGVSLWVAIFPADVCKSRIQVQAVDGKAAPTFLATITQIFKNEGQVGVTVFFYLFPSSFFCLFVLFCFSLLVLGFFSVCFFLSRGPLGRGGGILRTTVFLFVIQWFTHCKMHFISLVILSLFNTLCPACGWGDGGGCFITQLPPLWALVALPYRKKCWNSVLIKPLLVFLLVFGEDNFSGICHKVSDYVKPVLNWANICFGVFVKFYIIS